MKDKSSILSDVCNTLSGSGSKDAAELLRRQYPFSPCAPKAQNYSFRDATRVFVRDGFIDRYSGLRLIFPPVLRILSIMLPEDFPYHPHWKTGVTHPAYYNLFATIDHVVPVSRGGTSEEPNLVTTSMLKNSSKGNWTLEELDWDLLPSGDFKEWDGLLNWFVQFTETHPDFQERSCVRPWLSAVKQISR